MNYEIIILNNCDFVVKYHFYGEYILNLTGKIEALTGFIRGTLDPAKNTLNLSNEREEINIKTSHSFFDKLKTSLKNKDTSVLKKFFKVFVLSTVMVSELYANTVGPVNNLKNLPQFNESVKHVQQIQQKVTNSEIMEIYKQMFVGNKYLNSREFYKLDKEKQHQIYKFVYENVRGINVNINPEINYIFDGRLDIEYYNQKNPQKMDKKLFLEVRASIEQGIREILLKNIENAAKISGFKLFDSNGNLTEIGRKSVDQFLKHFKVKIYDMEEGNNNKYVSKSLKNKVVLPTGFGGFGTTSNGQDYEVRLFIPAFNDPETLKDLAKHGVLKKYIHMVLVLFAHESGHTTKGWVRYFQSLKENGTIPEKEKISEKTFDKYLAAENFAVYSQEQAFKDGKYAVNITLNDTKKIMDILAKHKIFDLNSPEFNKFLDLGDKSLLGTSLGLIQHYDAKSPIDLHKKYKDIGLTKTEAFYAKHGFEILKNYLAKFLKNENELKKELSAFVMYSAFTDNRSKIAMYTEYNTVPLNPVLSQKQFKNILTTDNSNSFFSKKWNYETDLNLVKIRLIPTLLYLAKDKISPEMAKAILKIYAADTYKIYLNEMKQKTDTGMSFIHFFGTDNKEEFVKIFEKNKNKFQEIILKSSYNTWLKNKLLEEQQNQKLHKDIHIQQTQDGHYTVTM